MIFEIGIIFMVMFASCACGACIGFLELFRKLSERNWKKNMDEHQEISEFYQSPNLSLESITSSISDEMQQIQYV